MTPVALMSQLVMRSAGILLLVSLMVAPAAYFKVLNAALQAEIDRKNSQVTQLETTVSLLKAQADEQQRALTKVYSLAEARNKKLKAQLTEARKAPPPKDCEGAMQWLRDKAQELEP